MKKYDHKKIEKKWQDTWKKSHIYETSNKAQKTAKSKPKSYVLDMFPYPSGTGLHVGHPKGYIATDVYSRFKTMNGFEVLHPMGWDAFGLPAEEFAIKNKIHPSIAVKKNVKRYKEQLSILGFNYDWSREINTTDPEYYKWTQWTFLQMYKKGLAFESHEPINWCPSCKTGLANEDLENGKCERCGSVVEKRPLRQWVLKITDYADRMLKDLDGLKWPESIKTSQRNWIGRSEGSEVHFQIKGLDEKIKIFTTRADTLFGVTYLVLAPECTYVKKWLQSGVLQNTAAVKKYILETKDKTDIERTAEGKEKNGIELMGITAINPATKVEIPVWIADYVLADYGTGAVMAVPAHDERDHQFAEKYKLPVDIVLNPFYAREDVANITTFEKKKKIVGIVEDGKGNVLTINWKPELGGRLYLGGTVENNDSAAETALRELAEETGYVDAKVVATSDETFTYRYFAHSKNKAYEALTTFVHIKLRSLKKNEQTLEEDEKNKFTVEWLSLAEAKDQVKEVLHVYGFNKFIERHPYIGEGTLLNSEKFSGLTSEAGRKEITAFVDGKNVVNYKLRDWVFSRQRYWGEPIPLIHCPDCGVVPVPEKDLPVKLPNVKSYEPTGTGESPLAKIDTWVNVKCPACGNKKSGKNKNGKDEKGKQIWAKRETNTMPQWAGSCWYYLRFIDPHNKKALVDPKKEKYWMPVDMYVGGAEHATRHLIYARFWHKFLYDIGVVSTIEPFMELKNQGLIAGPDGRKMSKRFGNVVNPDDIVKLYGADTLRIYEMFMGPFDAGIAWSTNNMIGSRRFIEKVWRLAEKVETRAENKTKKKDKTSTQNLVELTPETEALLHKTIKKVGEDIHSFASNTAISSLMILTNAFEKDEKIPREAYETLLKLLAPFAPHITEELWTELGNNKNSKNKKGSIHLEQWPVYDPKKLVSSIFTIVVQINGKVRAQFEIDTDNEKEVLEKALNLPEIVAKLEGKKPEKTIYVKGKLVSLVVRP